MWDANVGTTERVLDAAIDAAVPRILYVSTLGIHGNTRGRVVDETFRRDSTDEFLTWYDETKYRAHEAAEVRIAHGAPIVIGMPGQTYGPHDHSLPSLQLEDAFAGRLRYVAFPNTGLAWAHVHDLADGLVAALDRGRIGESYSLGGECRRIGESVAIAARAAGRRPPRGRVPVRLLRAVAPINDRIGGLPGMPGNLRRGHRLRRRRHLLGQPRQGRRGARLRSPVAGAGCRRHLGRDALLSADRHTLDPMARELPIFDPNPAHGHQPASAVSIAMGGGRFEPAADGTTPLRRHPDWIKARMPSGENYHDLKGLLRG